MILEIFNKLQGWDLCLPCWNVQVAVQQLSGMSGQYYYHLCKMEMA